MKSVTTAEQETDVAQKTRRIILTMGGKGGVGKTGFMIAIAEWYQANRIPITILDLDTENKAKGSLKHYFPSATKANIHTPAGLDAFIDHLEAEPRIILADMGSARDVGVVRR